MLKSKIINILNYNYISASVNNVKVTSKIDYMPDGRHPIGRLPIGGIQMGETQLEDTQLDDTPMAESHITDITN